MKVLLIEDETKLSEALTILIQRAGFEVDTALDGAKGLELALTDHYDVIVLDRMLPFLDGMTILKEIKKTRIKAPVLFLTAKDAPAERVEGLEAGADDYLVKPFFTEELIARIRVLIRRAGKNDPQDCLESSGLIFYPLHNLAIKNGEKISLTAKESALLALLMQNKNRVVTKEGIMEKIWGYDTEAGIGNVDLYIYYLRKKLNITNIKTIRGIGYSFEEDYHVS